MGGAVDDAVVEGVGRHVVAGLEDPGDDEALAAERQGRQQVGEELGGDGPRPAPREHVERVAVRVLRGEQVAHQVAQQLVTVLRARVRDVRARRHGQPDHPEPVHPVEERHPQRPGVPGGGHGLDVLEGTPRERPRDRHRVGVGQRGRRHRDQLALLVVGEVEPGRPAERAGRAVRRLRHAVGGRQVDVVEEVAQRGQGAGVAVVVRHPATLGRDRCDRSVAATTGRAGPAPGAARAAGQCRECPAGSGR